MQMQAESMLKAQSSRLDNYPEVRQSIDGHLEETLGQQTMLEGCMDSLGSSPSGLRDWTGRTAAFGRVVDGMTMTDEIVKGAMSGYVSEQTEVASYTALIAASGAADDKETLRCCEQNLPHEVEMGRWLLAYLPGIGTAYMSRSAKGHHDARR